MLETNTTYLAAPAEWDDPYEKASLHRPSTRVFAQCWCRKPTSDAMWRIYSPDRLGVRIDVERDQLQTALREASNKNKFGFRLQNVRYLWNELLDHERMQIQKRIDTRYSAAIGIKALFLKRDAFGHEHEVRLVMYDPSAPWERSDGKGAFLPLDMRSLILSVWIDSRAPRAYVDAYTYYLKEKLLFRGEVAQSGLYAEVPKSRSSAAR